LNSTIMFNLKTVFIVHSNKQTNNKTELASRLL
jgi:hypothetical protein